MGIDYWFGGSSYNVLGYLQFCCCIVFLRLPNLQRQLLGVLGDRGERKSSLSNMAGNEDDTNTANDDDDDDDQPFTPWAVSVAR